MTLLIVSIFSKLKGFSSESILDNKFLIVSLISGFEFVFDLLISFSVFFSDNAGLGNRSSSTSSRSIILFLEYFLYIFLIILLRLIIDLQIFFLLFEQATLNSFMDLQEAKESFKASSSFSFLNKLNP